MPAYMIADIRVHDPAAFERYRPIAAETIAKHGGHYIVRGGKTEVLEGGPEPERIVVVEFPDIEQLKRWYHSPEYAEGIRLRQSASVGRLIIVEGL